MRLIDADVIIRDLTAMKFLYDAIELDGMIEALKKAPTIKAAPVVHGEWRFAHVSGMNSIYKCSSCGFEMRHWELGRFCPSCGAKMTK